MTHSNNEPPTGPISGQTREAPAQPAHPANPGHTGQHAEGHASANAMRRWDTVRNLLAAVLLVGAGLLPWNLYFGVGIPGSKTALFGVLGVLTLLSLASLAVRGRLRFALNIPYLLLVLGFVVFDVFETIRSGSGVAVPGGVGPGGWLGIAGALLAAQPAITGANDAVSGWMKGPGSSATRRCSRRRSASPLICSGG